MNTGRAFTAHFMGWLARTALILPGMHVEPAPRRREAVAISGGRRGARRGRGEAGPGRGGGVVDEEVLQAVQGSCADALARGRGGAGATSGHEAEST